MFRSSVSPILSHPNFFRFRIKAVEANPDGYSLCFLVRGLRITLPSLRCLILCMKIM